MPFLKLGGFVEKYRRYLGRPAVPATSMLCPHCALSQPAYSRAQLSYYFKLRPVPKMVCARCGYHQSPRKNIDRKLKGRVLRADRHECIYCGATGGMTVDHLQPYSHGGLTVFENLVTCCLACNREKADRTDFRPARFGRFRAEPEP